LCVWLIFFFDDVQRLAIQRASKFARASACSEFAPGVPRWHGRIASVGWRFFFCQIFARMKLLENLQNSKTPFYGLCVFHSFHVCNFFCLGISSVCLKHKFGFLLRNTNLFRFFNRKLISSTKFFWIEIEFQRLKSKISPSNYFRILKVNSVWILKINSQNELFQIIFE
jgi:hypothetical protein